MGDEGLRQRVKQALAEVKHPELGRGLVELGMARDIKIENGKIEATLAVPFQDVPVAEQLVNAATEAIQRLDGDLKVEVKTVPMSQKERAAFMSRAEGRQSPTTGMNHVRHVIAVASGKGGVGKSAVAAQLAIALKHRGFSVGLMDADITGPSIPRMFGVSEHPKVTPLGIVPARTRLGIHVMSMNLLLPNEGEAVIWRGPLISNAIKQFWTEVFWGNLDYLVLDLPPGTSDASLTVMQSIPLSGVVLVTSPQSLAGMVVQKSARMAREMGAPLLGVIENMSYAVCPGCGKQIEVFGRSQGANLAARLNLPFLGRLPIDPELARLADTGGVERYTGEAFKPIADGILEELARLAAESAQVS